MLASGLSHRSRIAVWLVALAPAALAIQPVPAAGDVKVRLELSQQFFYVGDSLDVRLSVNNLTAKKIDNPIQTPLFDGFHVRSGGKEIERTGKTTAEEPTRPAKISPESFYGTVVNLVDLYPELGGSGVFEIYWGANGIVSDMLVVTVIPRFDPAKSYLGEIVTDQGSIVVDLFGKQSPIAVKSFVDMANAGFYDDLQISEIRSDEFIVGGDPRTAVPPRESIQFPAEQSTLPILAGSVVLRPVRATPPSNGSTFVITLKPQPNWAGQVTVLGQVVDGLDIVQQLSRLPSSERNSQPNFKPLRGIRIMGVRIREKPSESGAS